MNNGLFLYCMLCLYKMGMRWQLSIIIILLTDISYSNMISKLDSCISTHSNMLG